MVMIRGLVLAIAAPCADAGATSLTGLAEFSTCDDLSLCPAGSFGHNNSTASGSLWDTVGGNQAYNLYIAPGTASSVTNAGQFLNSGNTASSTAINLPLTVGTHTFSIFGDNHPGYSQGLSLFFDGNNGNPGISVYAPLRTGLIEPPIAADCAPTPVLGMGLKLAPGACTLSFFDGKNTITLTDYFWQRSDSLGHAVDLVSATSTNSDGKADFVGQFTLTVSAGDSGVAGSISAIPEPLSAALFGTGLIGLLTLLRLGSASSGRGRKAE
jgi:hypothetical protein